MHSARSCRLVCVSPAAACLPQGRRGAGGECHEEDVGVWRGQLDELRNGGAVGLLRCEPGRLGHVSRYTCQLRIAAGQAAWAEHTGQPAAAGHSSHLCRLALAQQRLPRPRLPRRLLRRLVLLAPARHQPLAQPALHEGAEQGHHYGCIHAQQAHRARRIRGVSGVGRQQPLLPQHRHHHRLAQQQQLKQRAAPVHAVGHLQCSSGQHGAVVRPGEAAGWRRACASPPCPASPGWTACSGVRALE